MFKDIFSFIFYDVVIRIQLSGATYVMKEVSVVYEIKVVSSHRKPKDPNSTMPVGICIKCVLAPLHHIPHESHMLITSFI